MNKANKEMLDEYDFKGKKACAENIMKLLSKVIRCAFMMTTELLPKSILLQSKPMYIGIFQIPNLLIMPCAL